MEKRYTIGVMIGNANSPHTMNLMQGIFHAAKSMDVNVLFFFSSYYYKSYFGEEDVYKRQDPWRWRIAIAKRHDVLYGKFFAKKAGFISKKWLPVFANYRRDGYDFDALFEDEKAPIKHKNIMDHFMENDAEIYSCLLYTSYGHTYTYK